MEIRINKNYDAMCRAAADYIVAYVQNKPKSLIELPGGETPLGIYRYLVQEAKAGTFDVSECTFVSLDEWGGLGYDTKGSCIQMLYDHFYSKLPIDQDRQVCFFDGTADLNGECKRIDQFILDHGQIDIAVLGIGMNGHIGFNEPGVDENQYCTVVLLDDVTQSVSVKYFGEQLDIIHGITLGMKHFFEAQEVLLIADSMRKSEIVREVLKGPVTNEVPASLMRKKEGSILFLDEDAASRLSD